MLRGPILFLVLAYTVLMLAAADLPPNYAAAATSIAPLIEFVAVARSATSQAFATKTAGLTATSNTAICAAL